VETAEASLPAHGWPCRALSNHDNRRHATRFGAETLRAAAVLSLTLRGTPVMYMGEEIGMADLPVPAGAEHDRAGRDAARTPMQWRDAPGAGFTSSDRPWLPIGDTRRVNVADQAADATSLFSLYRRLIAERAASPALLGGTYRGLDTPLESNLFAYLREVTGERLLVIVGCGAQAGQHDLVAAARGRIGAQGRLRLSTETSRQPGESVDLSRLELTANEAIIVTL